MSWKRFAVTISAGILVGTVTVAQAADQEYGRSGPYLGADGIYAIQEFSDGGKRSPDNSGGYGLKAGYRFNEYFALEGSWQQFLNFSDTTGDTDIFIGAVNGKFYPLSGMIQPYLMAGVGYEKVNDDRAPSENTGGVGFNFGGGLDVYVTRNWALSVGVGYVLGASSGLGDYGVVPLSFGILYRFY